MPRGDRGRPAPLRRRGIQGRALLRLPPRPRPRAARRQAARRGLGGAAGRGRAVGPALRPDRARRWQGSPAHGRGRAVGAQARCARAHAAGPRHLPRPALRRRHRPAQQRGLKAKGACHAGGAKARRRARRVPRLRARRLSPQGLPGRARRAVQGDGARPRAPTADRTDLSPGASRSKLRTDRRERQRRGLADETGQARAARQTVRARSRAHGADEPPLCGALDLSRRGARAWKLAALHLRAPAHADPRAPGRARPRAARANGARHTCSSGSRAAGAAATRCTPPPASAGAMAAMPGATSARATRTFAGACSAGRRRSRRTRPRRC